MRFLMALLLLAGAAMTSRAQVGVFCGSDGPQHDVGGDKIVIGTYGTAAEAKAALENQAWVDSVFWRAVMEHTGDVCEPCGVPGQCKIAPHLSVGVYDLESSWDADLKRWVVTINIKPNCLYWISCSAC